MDGGECTVTVEHEGFEVSICATPGAGAPNAEGRAEHVALDIGRILKVANCVAACLLSTVVPPPGLTDLKPTAAKPTAAK